MKKLFIYIASPYSIGDKLENVKRSLRIADEIMDAGHFPFSPLLPHFWNEISPKSYDVWLHYCLAWVTKCDVVYRLPGESSGADKEVQLAKDLGIPVVYNSSQMSRFLEMHKEKYESLSYRI